MSDGDRFPGEMDSRAAAESAPPDNFARKWAVRTGSLLMIVSVVAWIYARSGEIVVDDARFVADMTTASSPCECVVFEIHVKEGAWVAKGAPLVSLDASEAKLAHLEAHERASSARAHIDLLQKQATLLRMTRSRNEEAMSIAVDRSSALDNISQSSLIVVGRKLDRARKLRESQLLSDSDVDRVRSEWLEAKRNFEIASSEKREAAINRTASAESNMQIAISEAEIATQKRDLAALEALEARLRLLERQRLVLAPFNGIVDRIFAREGDRASDGRRLVLMHDPQSIYVEANIKETDLRFVNAGRPVAVRIDAYPSQEFNGFVEQVGAATTGQFALLPAVTPSGSFVKLTQRVPIRVKVFTLNLIVRPGMQVELRLRR